MIDEEQTPTRRKGLPRRVLRQVLRWTLRIVGGLVLLVLGLLAFVMLTGAGTRWALSTGVRAYGKTIPGDIRVAQIDGTLVGGISLEGLVLQDALGHTLVSAERVTLALSWTSLASKHVEVVDLSLAGVVVDLPTEGAGFGDLAPPPSEEPEPPSETLGPDLPVRISGTVNVERLEVVQAQETLVSVAQLELGLDAEGTAADVRLAAALDVPVAELEIASIELQARWSEPKVVLEALAIETNRGEVTLARVEADVAAQSGRLDGLKVVAAQDAWSELTGLPAAIAPTITLDAEGAASGLQGELAADLGEGGTATLRVSGAAQPALDLHVELRVDTALENFVPDLPPRAIHVDSELELAGALDGVLTAALDLTCRGCAEAQRPARLRIGAEAVDTRLFGGDKPAWVALADLDLMYEGTTLALTGTYAPDGTASARLELPVARLAALGRAAGGYAELPPLEGTADAAVDCFAELSTPTIVCAVDAGIEDGAPVKVARVDATAATVGFESLRADVRDLRVNAQGADARLVGSGASVRLDSEALVVDGLGLHVVTPTGDGKITVGGAVSKDKAGVLTARLVDVDLGLARTFVPDLAIDGRLDGSVRVSGTPAVPRVAASLQTKGLAVAGFRVGDVDVGADYRDTSVTADVDVRDGDIGRWTVDASARAGLSLDPPGFEPRLSRPLRLDVRARELELATLARKVDGMPELSGTIGLDVSLRGNAKQPTVHAEVTGSRLAFEGHTVGELAVEADYEGGRAKVITTLEHPKVESVRLEAEAPVRLTLEGAPRWQQDGDHEVSLEVRKAQLAAANEHADIDLGGTLDLDVGVTGSARSPKLDLLAGLDRASFGGREVASGALRVTYDDSELETVADFRGPAFAGLGMRATVPLTAGVSGAQWHADREHHLSVALVGVSLFEAAAWMPEPLDLGGHLDATVNVRGTALTPVAEVTANGRRITYGGRDVGNVTLEAGYRGQAADARLDWVLDPSHRATIRARVPLKVDAQAGQARWLANAPHQLRVDIPRIDRALLEPFVELPQDADFATSCVVLLDGSAKDFALSAAMRGYVRSPDGDSAPIDIDIDADPRRQLLAVSIGPSVTATLATEADVTALREGTTAVGDIPIEGRVLVDALSLGFLAELAPEQLYNVQGQLDVDASIGGTPDAPQLDGWAELSSGAMTLVALRQRLTGMTAKVDFSNDRIILEKLVTNSGAGRVVGEGEVRLGGGRADGTLRLNLDQMPAQSPGLPRLEITSKITAELEASSERARVDVALAGTRVDVLASSVEAAKPIPSSAGVRYVGSLDAPERPDEPEAADTDPVPWLVRVEMVDPLRIVGPAVDMSWGGSIVAESDGGPVRTSGRLASTEGFLELLSNRFEIERGTVTFAEGDDVQLFADVLATSTIGEVDVSAEIRGPLPRPELRLTSVPALTESQIFTVMLTGEADVDSLDPEEAQAQAASLLAAVSSPALQRQLNDRLRVDRIGVGVGETTRDPILTVGKNISRHVYAETQYRHNAPINDNRAELRVRYRFAPRWSLESFFGDAAAGGLAIFWTRTFDSRRQ